MCFAKVFILYPEGQCFSQFFLAADDMKQFNGKGECVIVS